MATFYNQATLAYNGTTVNSNITTGEITERITVTKTALTDGYSENDEITYVVTISNSGTSAANGIVLTDNLGEYDYGTTTLVPLEYIDGALLYYINSVLQPTPTITVGPPLSITGINIPAGGYATIVYNVKTNQYAPLEANTSIVNTATVSGGGLITPVTATETVIPQNNAVLTITKSLLPTVIENNGTINYTFLIENRGNQAATVDSGVVLTDTFNPILSDLTVTFNDVTWTEGANYNYDNTTGEFSTINGEITVPAATFTQDETTGAVVVTPGTAVIKVTGKI